jgi:hypothetical protein
MKKIIQKTVPIMLAALVLAGCSPLFRETETGQVPVSITLKAPGEAGEGDARTLMPAGGANGLFYGLRFSRGETALEETLDAGLGVTVPLGPGGWNLLVHGYGNAADRETGPGRAVLSGAAQFTVQEGPPVSVTVNLAAATDSTVTGTFGYTIRFPDTVSYGLLTLSPLGGGTAQNRNILAASGENTVSASGSDKIAAGSFTNLPAGYYRLGLELYDQTYSRIARKSEVLHIYGGMESRAEGPDYTFAVARFAAGAIRVAYATDLPTTLANILAGSAGAYLVELPANETCPPMNLITTGAKQFDITLRGNGHTLDLSSAGSLFTIGTDPSVSWKITLRLENIILAGRPDNTNSLVVVKQSGTLTTNYETKITGNTLSAASDYGGGVYVASGGTFYLIDGEISGNSGGVFNGGTFAQYGGKISNNTAVFSTGIAEGGGGVYTSGTFYLYGGEISGNTVSSGGNAAFARGGGVFIGQNGSFFMHGGNISNNTVTGQYTQGGGVFAASSSRFDMYGGTISGHTVGAGGGVFVYYSSFMLYGGTISGNTASSYGGGVLVYCSSFMLYGGTISGNTANYSYGGEVYIISS